ncbi:MAG: hypothetical protein MRK02_12780 [Candidatus Scalindua sp.]|nr:hypothetical protein [Candidatus Scalindua sp.]
MNTCSLSEFMQTLTPWLSSDYLKKASLDNKGHLILLFTDGIQNVYNIDDCTEPQLKEILDNLKKKGIQVED